MKLEEIERLQARPVVVEKPVTGDSPEGEVAPVYENIYDVPASWRTYRSARLSIAQINSIMADAYDNKIDPGDGAPIPDYGGARERFEQSHTIEDGFWVGKESE